MKQRQKLYGISVKGNIDNPAAYKNIHTGTLLLEFESEFEKVLGIKMRTLYYGKTQVF